MPIEEEQSARDAIERMIGDWDAAYTEGNAHGLVGHCLPDATSQEEHFRQWTVVMDWTEDTAAQSTVRQFRLEGEQATLVVEQCRSFCFRHPLPEYALPGRALLGFFARFVFIERETSRFTWVNTREGWLCRSEQRLSYRLRVRRRVASAP